ncbi:MAG TPA: isochorismatase family cysteine hydrolase [Stellaceae bacterium]|nr:isochorismatase family cysteine hydrolase [Stellaceae bacterium]
MTIEEFEMTEALVIIDMQRWFFRTEARSGKLALLLSQVNALAQAAAVAGRSIIIVRTAHTPDRSSWSLPMRRMDSGVMIEGTRDVEDVDGLWLPAITASVVKTRHSAFIRTDFEAVLRSAGITSLLLSGAFIDGCVGLTAIDASERDFQVRIAGDAVISVDDSQGEAMLRFLNSEFDVPAVRTGSLLAEFRNRGPDNI